MKLVDTSKGGGSAFGQTSGDKERSLVKMPFECRLLFCRVLFSRAQNRYDQLDVDAVCQSTIRIFSSEASGLPSD